MPISTNPLARAKYYFDGDENIPHADRPHLLIKFMTRGEIEQHAELMKQAFAAQLVDGREAYRLMAEAFAVGIVGWKNFKGEDGKESPFSIAAIFSILTERELWVLGWHYPSAVKMASEEVRNFLSQSPIFTGVSVAKPATGVAGSLPN